MPDTQSTPSEDNLNRRLLRLDAQIKIEYDLIGHRLSWLLTSNSFLFAAFVVGLNNANRDISSVKNFIGVLTISLPVIGLVSSVLVWLAVFAADSVICKFKRLRDTVEDEATRYGFEVLGIKTGAWPHRVGNWPPFFLPPLLAIIWAWLLYRRVLV